MPLQRCPGRAPPIMLFISVGYIYTPEAWLDDLAVDISSVPDLKDCHVALRVVDEIDDAILALAYPIAVVVPGKFLGLL